MSYQTEEEQIHAIVQWIKKHQTILLVGFVVIAATSLGVQYYFHHQAVQREKASVAYDLMLKGVAKKDEQTAENQAKLLIDKYPKTPYAQMAHLVLGSIFVHQGDLEQASSYLEEALNHKDQGQLSHVARARYARVLLANGKSDKALSVINSVEHEGYATLYEEVKGDIYLSINEPKKALKAYQKARFSAPDGVSVPWLELKIADLGNIDE